MRTIAKAGALVLVSLGADVVVAADLNTKRWCSVRDPDALQRDARWAKVDASEHQAMYPAIRNIVNTQSARASFQQLQPAMDLGNPFRGAGGRFGSEGDDPSTITETNPGKGHFATGWLGESEEDDDNAYEAARKFVHENHDDSKAGRVPRQPLVNALFDTGEVISHDAGPAGHSGVPMTAKIVRSSDGRSTMLRIRSTETLDELEEDSDRFEEIAQEHDADAVDVHEHGVDYIWHDSEYTAPVTITKMVPTKVTKSVRVKKPTARDR